MKRTALTLLTIINLVSTASLAQGAASKTKFPKTAPPTYNYDPDAILVRPSPYMAAGFNLGFEYLAANSAQSDVKSKVTGNVEKGLKKDLAIVPKQLGLKVGYKQIPRGGMGFDLSLSVLKMESRPEDTSDFTTLMPSANFILAAPKYAYGALGVNTSIVVGDENAEHSPHIGFQIGGGVVLKKNFNFEVFYSWINQGIEYQYALTEERVTATNARLIYAF
jgi:hypothetical protein